MPSDLTLKPDFVYEENIRHKTLVSEFENGYEQRRAKWAAPLRIFHLSYRNRSSSDLGTLKTLFTAKMGMATPFTWTNPNDNVEYSVRFQEDSFNFKNKAYGIYDVEFTLVQVK